MSDHKYAGGGGGAASNARAYLREHGAGATAARAVTVAREVGARRVQHAAWRAQGRVLRRRTPPEFEFGGRRHRYFWHPYNFTWRNERAVEVPIVWSEVERSPADRVLEVGNVLGHYFDARHDVVDKFERAPGVVNADLLEYAPERDYDLVVTISTLEHVGWDDDPRDPPRVGRAFEHLRTLLAPGGRALVTVPIGQNPYLDDLVATADPRLGELRFLSRTGPRTWAESDAATALKQRYGDPHPGANAVVVASLRGLTP